LEGQASAMVARILFDGFELAAQQICFSVDTC
jgi:hypothetical protein